MKVRFDKQRARTCKAHKIVMAKMPAGNTPPPRGSGAFVGMVRVPDPEDFLPLEDFLSSVEKYCVGDYVIVRSGWMGEDATIYLYHDDDFILLLLQGCFPDRCYKGKKIWSRK